MTSDRDTAQSQLLRGAALVQAKFGDLLESTLDAMVIVNWQGSIVLTQSRADGALSTRFAVQDTGIGIAPEDQEKLFKSFEQVGRSGARRREGAGLGLHLSQKLAALLGGRIEFESEPGNGSRFTLVIEEH